MKEGPDFLTVEEVVALHHEQIERYGGLGGVRDKALLESAVAAPRSSFEGELLHESVFHAAAAYAFHLAQNQPFLDGNKRTALAAALVFLDLNGYEVLDSEGSLY